MTKREALRIEVRAAEIAAAMIYNLTNIMTGRELGGWARAGDKRERGGENNWEWQAGWLAAQIWYEFYQENGWSVTHGLHVTRPLPDAAD